MSSFYDDASLVVIPSGYKTSKVYAQKPTDGSGDLTFTRASSATRVGPNGLIEEVRENLALYSEQFNDAYWTKTDITVTANTTANPVNGATTADTLTRTGALVGFTNRQIAQTGIVTFSVYAKAGTTNLVRLNTFDGSADRGATYNLTTGAITSPYGSPLFTTSQALSNGWYRISISVNSATYTRCQIHLDTINSVIVFGAQLETGDIATDYIPTTTATLSVGPVSNVPRLDYLGSTCPRLLLEPQRTNALTFSEQFNNAAWTLDGDGVGQSLTANYAISPDGYQNADRLQLNKTGGTFSRIRQTAAGANTYTFSVYMKSNTSVSQNVGLRLDTTGVNRVVTTSWQRFTLTATVGTPQAQIMLFDSIVGNDEIADILIWGAQLEAGSYATSYIPTLSASVTRVADAASKTGISSLIGQTEGAVFFEIDQLANVSKLEGILYLSDGTSTTDYINFYFAFSNILYCDVAVGGVSQASFNLGTITTLTKIALAYKANDFAVYKNGVQIGTDNSGNVPTTSKLTLGATQVGNAVMKGVFAQALLFKTRLTNAQLAELTTL
jgi:hypothetical protein